MIGGASSGRRSTRGTCSRFSLTCAAVSYLSKRRERNIYIVRASCLLLQAPRICKRKGLGIRCCRAVRALFLKKSEQRIHATRVNGFLLVFGFPMGAIGLVFHSYRAAYTMENNRGTLCSSAANFWRRGGLCVELNSFGTTTLLISENRVLVLTGEFRSIQALEKDRPCHGGNPRLPVTDHNRLK